MSNSDSRGGDLRKKLEERGCYRNKKAATESDSKPKLTRKRIAPAPPARRLTDKMDLRKKLTSFKKSRLSVLSL